jgi:hypothetical protein
LLYHSHFLIWEDWEVSALCFVNVCMHMHFRL